MNMPTNHINQNGKVFFANYSQTSFSNIINVKRHIKRKKNMHKMSKKI